MVKEIKIGNKKIGDNHPCFIVAEMSANHNQDFNRAKKIVKAACEAGADAVKLQTYTPDTLTINSQKDWFLIKAENPWKGRNLYELYSKNYMPWEWQPELKKIAESYGKVLFSTAYDDSAVDFLEKMGVPAYKVTSFELTDLELLKKIARTKKPVIISRGMSNLTELTEAISTLRENGASEIAVLHCVSSYPAKPEQMNLATIPDIKKRFGVMPGLSDHTLTTSIAVAAAALGVCIIEKHLTLSRADGGPDASFSLEPNELKNLVKSVREAEKAIGRPHFGLEKNETEISLRRSLFAVKNIKQGEKFSKENIRSIRPGYGLAPKFLPKILNKKAAKNIERGTPLSDNLISD